MWNTEKRNSKKKKETMRQCGTWLRDLENQKWYKPTDKGVFGDFKVVDWLGKQHILLSLCL